MNLFSDNLAEELKFSVEQLVQQDKFSEQASLLPYQVSKEVNDKSIYIIEAGGTNWRLSKKINGQWFGLANGKENEINYHGENSLKYYFNFLMQTLVKIDGAITCDALCCVWSNSAYAKESSSPGIIGIELHVDLSTGYNKGEIYTRDLLDGENLGLVILEASQKYDIKFSTIIMTNDTSCLPFIIRDQQSFDAGVVISTGANGTGVKNLNGILQHVNLESGNRIRYPITYLKYHEKKIFEDHSTDDLPIEFLAAGKYYQKLFKAGLMDYCNLDLDLSLEDINLLALGVLPNNNFQKYQEQLFSFAKQYCYRAAFCGAIIAYASYFHLKLNLEKNSFQIAIDSSLCRKSEAYRDCFTQSLDLLCGQHNFSVLNILEDQQGREIPCPSEAIANIKSFF